LSHFEYISVAVSLVYSLILAKLLGALPATLNRERRYWVHSLWVVNLLLATLGSWWEIWFHRDVAWNPLSFFALLVIPSIIYLRAAMLLSDRPGEVPSWRAHYFRVRRSFFFLQILGSVHFTASPWLIAGATRGSETLLGSLAFAALALGAAISRAPRVHEAVALLSFLAYLLAFFFEHGVTAA
jgi:hypothetical protein